MHPAWLQFREVAAARPKCHEAVRGPHAIAVARSLEGGQDAAHAFNFLPAVGVPAGLLPASAALVARAAPQPSCVLRSAFLLNFAKRGELPLPRALVALSHGSRSALLVSHVVQVDKDAGVVVIEGHVAAEAPGVWLVFLGLVALLVVGRPRCEGSLAVGSLFVFSKIASLPKIVSWPR